MKNKRELGNKNLLDVAKSCRETNYPEDFSMGSYFTVCGTPACALGNWAARTDLQDLLVFKNGMLSYRNSDAMYAYADYDDSAILGRFDINRNEAEELFGSEGCGFAITAAEAATYIKKFVENRK